jgi:hypothetical protein
MNACACMVSLAVYLCTRCDLERDFFSRSGTNKSSANMEAISAILKDRDTPGLHSQLR